jgi:hypothetical protein
MISQSNINKPLLRSRISSNIYDLNELNKIYNWLPNEYNVRPDSITLEQKRESCKEILLTYGSFESFILETIFKPANSNWIFTPATFRYNLPHNSNHFVLWNSDKDLMFEYDDEIINQKITEKLDKLNLYKTNSELSLKNKYTYDFAWYKNPKPTVFEYYHVQVFWIRIKLN